MLKSDFNAHNICTVKDTTVKKISSTSLFIVLAAALVCTVTWAQEPTYQATADFLERHFRQHAHANLDAGCGANDPECASHRCSSTIKFTVSEQVAEADFDCTANRQQYGGKIRFDPSRVEASCADQTYKGVAKFITFRVIDPDSDNTIFIDPGFEDARMDWNVPIAAFSEADQCERAVKAFEHLSKFKVEDPF